MKKITLLMLIVFTTVTMQAQNQLLSSIEEYNYSGNWVNGNGFNYEYDGNNNLIAETYYQWNNVAWENQDKTIYTYNVDNRVTQATHQVWNPQTNMFEHMARDTYTYTDGKLTGITQEQWWSSFWVNDYKFVIAYNSNTLPVTVLSFNWDGSQWYDDERTTYTYDAGNKVSTEIYQEWIYGLWVNATKSIYTYDSNNKLITDKGSNWDESNNMWVEAGAHRVDYEWDAAGNRISRTASGNYYEREDYSYDSSNLMSNFVHPFKDKTGLDYFLEGFPYVNKVVTNNTSNYGTPRRTTYNYTNSITLATETVELATAAITVFPNPAKDYLSIQTPSNTEIDKITVTDMTGKKVLEQKHDTTQVDVQNLAKGIYVLEVSMGENKETRKFLKE